MKKMMKMKRKHHMSKFSDLITSLGSLLGTSLEVEKEILCKIKIRDLISIQMEYDEQTDRIILVSFLGELPPGKFREEALLAALKANHIDTSLGSFAYIDAKQMLIVQLFLPVSTAAPLLATLVQQLTEKAIAWKNGIAQGTLSSLVPNSTSSLPSPMNFS
jgi:hypothetical protein